MKKKVCAVLFLIVCLLFSGCGSNASEHDPQSEGLPGPDRIEVWNGNVTLIYGEEDAEYKKLFDALTRNWWMTVEGEPDVASDSQLVKAKGLKELKTSTWRTYRREDDNFVIFCYEDPIDWRSFDGDPLEVKAVAFLIPKHVEDCDNVKGYFTASQSGEIGINEGMYTFYYPAHMLDGFFRWLVH